MVALNTDMRLDAVQKGKPLAVFSFILGRTARLCYCLTQPSGWRDLMTGRSSGQREFMTLLGGPAWPLVVRTQQASRLEHGWTGSFSS
jgi:hypothetical protein